MMTYYIIIVNDNMILSFQPKGLKAGNQKLSYFMSHYSLYTRGIRL